MERPRSHHVGLPPRIDLEVPYITAAKELVDDKELPFGFHYLFNRINNELMRKPEGEDKGGLFVWESKKYPGVKFLAGHFRITEDIVRKIAYGSGRKTPISYLTPDIQAGSERRIKHVVRFLQPAFGLGKDGSGFSVLDMAFSPAIDMATMISASIRRGEIPPKGDIYLLGTPTALGGETTESFNRKVKEARDKGQGLDPYGEIFAEFVEAHVPQEQGELEATKIVIEGISKGAVTAHRTFTHLSEEIKERAQLLLDNPAIYHGKREWGSRNIPTQIGRGINLLGFVAEVVARMPNKFGKTLTKNQPIFYQEIAKELEIADESSEQKKLKNDLRMAELTTLVHGAPIDKSVRAFEKVSSPDTANTSFRTIRRVLSLRFKKRPYGIHDLMLNDGKIVVFPNANKTHMWPWMRSIDSGSWERKMEYIETTTPPKSSSHKPALD